MNPFHLYIVFLCLLTFRSSQKKKSSHTTLYTTIVRRLGSKGCQPSTPERGRFVCVVFDICQPTGITMTEHRTHFARSFRFTLTNASDSTFYITFHCGPPACSFPYSPSSHPSKRCFKMCKWRYYLVVGAIRTGVQIVCRLMNLRMIATKRAEINQLKWHHLAHGRSPIKNGLDNNKNNNKINYKN